MPINKTGICKSKTYPPIKIIGLFFIFFNSPMPACFAFFRLTAMPMILSSSLSRSLTRPPYSTWPALLADSNRPSAFMASSSIGCPSFSLRIISRNDTSAFPNKHTLRLPSLVMRKRLQVPQKLCVMLVMKPTRPSNPGTRYVLLVSFL
ncbi:hypothetical protein I7I50_01502 [Histoplasma capsulatum G186AR]|uniref:Uncharacterized protein n=1 Tax=Ajellomyces capsulatus TaxID=5037 RepID=A0A8H7YFN2_AJECA|nr:hypothetical protein I7I52_12618 [Histoplasma capsulatum]QSS73366.1 hypothetical protein I7I50_01502 [Histoplasma capsulatum G186AR]